MTTPDPQPWHPRDLRPTFDTAAREAFEEAQLRQALREPRELMPSSPDYRRLMQRARWLMNHGCFADGRAICTEFTCVRWD